MPAKQLYPAVLHAVWPCLLCTSSSSHSDYNVLCCAVTCAVLCAVQLDPEAEDLIRSLLVLDPERRLGSGGVHQIQRHPFFATIAWGSLEAEVERDQAHYEEMQMQRLQQGVEDLAAGSSSGSNGGYSSYDRSNGSNGAGRQYRLMAEQQDSSKAESPASRWGL